MTATEQAEMSQETRELIEDLQRQLADARVDLEHSQGRERLLQTQVWKMGQEIENQKAKRKSERERLAAWLDRRITQQEEALLLEFIGHETKCVVEIELSLLKRYREYVVENKERSADEDPLMMKFV